MITLEQIDAKLDAVLRIVATKPAEKKPGYTIADFARLSNRSRSTIERMLKRGELRREKGRIPAEQLNPFLS